MGFPSWPHSGLSFVLVLVMLLAIVYTIAMPDTSPKPFDILSNDGTTLRRGYIELVLDMTTSNEIPPAQQGNPGVIVQLYETAGRKERIADDRVFGTNLPAEMTDEQRRKTIVGLMNELTERYGVSSFTDSLDIWDRELERFREVLTLADPSWYVDKA
jgi:hypothetical protein